MRKNVLLVVFANLILLLSCSQEKLSREQLIGTWKHPLYAGAISINDGEKTPMYNYEMFQFKADGTFVFGEYGASPLYEVNGRWELSDDRKNIEFSFDDGQTSSIDIREFDGSSFVTTSGQGNDFKYTKE